MQGAESSALGERPVGLSRASTRALDVELDDGVERGVVACDPLEVEIEGDFNVRGNIKTVVRASYKRGEDQWAMAKSS